MTKLRRYLCTLLAISMLAAGLLLLAGLIVLDSPGLAEEWFALDEFQLAQLRDQVHCVVPYLVIAIIIIYLLIIFYKGIKNRYRVGYWLTTLLFFPLMFGIPLLQMVVLPFDRSYFREPAKTEAIMQNFANKNVFKNQPIQVLSFGLHFRDVPLQSGVYATIEVINPKTKLVDEYWYWSTNLFQKWQKDSDTITNHFSADELIDFNQIDWRVIPKIIQQSEARIAKLEHYYRGINIILLVQGFEGPHWTVGIEGVRGDTSLSLNYDLSGHYLGYRQSINSSINEPLDVLN